MRERVLAMKALWAEEEAEYHGEMVDFDKVWSWPKPVQKPHPPIILGGETDYTLRRVVEYCDGWFPRPGRGAEIAEQLRRPRGRRCGCGVARSRPAGGVGERGGRGLGGPGQGGGEGGTRPENAVASVF